MTFLECPAYLGHNGQARCGLPAEITGRYFLSSTDGPVECATIRCPCRHWFNGSLESLALPGPCGLEEDIMAITESDQIR